MLKAQSYLTRHQVADRYCCTSPQAKRKRITKTHSSLRAHHSNRQDERATPSPRGHTYAFPPAAPRRATK